MSTLNKTDLKGLFDSGDSISQESLYNLVDSYPSFEDDEGLIKGVKNLSSNTPNGNDTSCLGCLGRSPNGDLWYKKSGDNTDTGWEKIFVTEDGEFSANIVLQDFGDTIPSENVLGRKGSNISVGYGRIWWI